MKSIIISGIGALVLTLTGCDLDDAIYENPRIIATVVKESHINSHYVLELKTRKSKEFTLDILDIYYCPRGPNDKTKEDLDIFIKEGSVISFPIHKKNAGETEFTLEIAAGYRSADRIRVIFAEESQVEKN